jgi:hypothetical protein
MPNDVTGLGRDAVRFDFSAKLLGLIEGGKHFR